jgi:hypothetical protein
MMMKKFILKMQLSIFKDMGGISAEFEFDMESINDSVNQCTVISMPDRYE